MSEDRPRLILVTRNLPPLVGGMERLNTHLVLELAKSYEVTVIGPRGVLAPGAGRVLACPSKRLPLFFLWAAWTAVIISVRIRPRWVLGGSGLVAPLVLLAARASRARAGLYLHGLDIVARHPLYRAVWLPAIRRADLCIANSTNTRELAVSVGVSRRRIKILFPGVHLNRPAGESQRFRQNIGVSTEPVLLSVGRLTGRKGVVEFIRDALPDIAKQHPLVKFVIIGDEAPDALLKGRTDQRARIMETISMLGLRDNVVLLGSVDDAVLSDALAAADVHIFPVIEKAGDVEGFGMVALEASAAGIPTVAYAVGGVPDAVANGKSGTLVPPGDHRAFSDAVLAHLANGKEVTASECHSFAKAFGWQHFGDRLRQLLRNFEVLP